MSTVSKRNESADVVVWGEGSGFASRMRQVHIG